MGCLLLLVDCISHLCPGYCLWNSNSLQSSSRTENDSLYMYHSLQIYFGSVIWEKIEIDAVDIYKLGNPGVKEIIA